MQNNKHYEDKMVTDDRLFKLPKMPYTHTSTGPCYAIFRIGKKFKSKAFIKGFVKHMERLQDTPNADVSRLEYNRTVYGPIDGDVYADCRKYLEDVKIYKNSNIAREVLCTASPHFFKGISEKDFTTWVNINIEWLKKTFSDNLRVAYLHLDESSPHLHALIIPKLWHEKKQCYTLQSYKYFDGVDLFRNLQDSYHEHMKAKFPVIERGIKGSKAKHQGMQKWYSIINKNSKENNIEVLQARAAHEEMLKQKVNFLDKTIKSKEYHNKLMVDELLKDNDRLRNELDQLKKEKLIDTSSEKEKVNKISVKNGLDYREILKKSKSKEKSIDR